MADELMKTAAAHMKKAVPLMLKHSIPTTPTNYALWYTYVGESAPELNHALDEVIAQYQTCPVSQSQLLYRQYVSDPEQLDIRQMKQSLEAMVQELSQSLKDTHHDTGAFQQKIHSQLSHLSQLEQQTYSLEQVMDMVRGIVNESDNIHSSTRYFSAQLERAEQEIMRLKQRLAATEQDSLHDALTGILNRRAFDADLQNLSSVNVNNCGLILADIDHFKQFNDSFGHQLGDQVLKAVAKRLGEHCRDGARVYRYGGEEFAILVPNRPLPQIRHLADSMRRGIEKITIKDRRKGGIIDGISASFGVSCHQQAESLSQFIAQADTQLYEAKKLGRNRVMPIIA